MTTTTTDAPPEKLSDLIELAVADAQKLDRKVYLPVYSDWHANRGEATTTEGGTPEETICRICLCGGILAGRLGATPDRSFVLHDVGSTIEITDGEERIGRNGWGPALAAVDEARDGGWLRAAQLLRIRMSQETIQAVCEIEPAYYRNFRGWEEFDRHCESMSERARELRALGV